MVALIETFVVPQTKTSSSNPVPLTIMARCNEIWSANGLDSLTSHSFCVGGAMEMLLQGVNPKVVIAQGRWLSDLPMRLEKDRRDTW